MGDDVLPDSFLTLLFNATLSSSILLAHSLCLCILILLQTMLLMLLYCRSSKCSIYIRCSPSPSPFFDSLHLCFSFCRSLTPSSLLSAPSISSFPIASRVFLSRFSRCYILCIQCSAATMSSWCYIHTYIPPYTQTRIRQRSRHIHTRCIESNWWTGEREKWLPAPSKRWRSIVFLLSLLVVVVLDTPPPTNQPTLPLPFIPTSAIYNTAAAAAAFFSYFSVSLYLHSFPQNTRIFSAKGIRGPRVSHSTLSNYYSIWSISCKIKVSLPSVSSSPKTL